MDVRDRASGLRSDVQADIERCRFEEFGENVLGLFENDTEIHPFFRCKAIRIFDVALRNQNKISIEIWVLACDDSPVFGFKFRDTLILQNNRIAKWARFYEMMCLSIMRFAWLEDSHM